MRRLISKGWFRIIWAAGCIIILYAMMFLPNPLIASRTGVIAGYVSGDFVAGIPLSSIDYFIYERAVVISPSDVTLTTDVSGWTETKINTAVATVHGAGKKIFAELFNYYGDDEYDVIFNNSSLRNDLVSNLHDCVDTWGFDGIDIDWESETMNTTNFSLFITDLKSAISPKELSIFVPQHLKLINTSAINALSFITVSAYDIGTPWYGSYSAAKSAMAYWSNYFGVDKSKLLMGISFNTSTDISNGSVGWVGYNDIGVDSTTPGQDNAVSGRYYNGIYTVRNKADWVMSEGYGGVNGYTLNDDLYAVTDRSLMRQIKDAIKPDNSTLAFEPPTSNASTAQSLTGMGIVIFFVILIIGIVLGKRK